MITVLKARILIIFLDIPLGLFPPTHNINLELGRAEKGEQEKGRAEICSWSLLAHKFVQSSLQEHSPGRDESDGNPLVM